MFSRIAGEHGKYHISRASVENSRPFFEGLMEILMNTRSGYVMELWLREFFQANGNWERDFVSQRGAI